MHNHLRQIAGLGCVLAVLVVATACAPKRVPPMSVEDLMEDRVTLDGVLLKCNQDPAKARSSSDCLNARIAIDRLASQVDPAEEAKRNAEFERQREKRRLEQERQRQEQEQQAKATIDPYTLPVVPVDTGSTAPVAAQTKP
jgi:uncharacterized protein YaiL (DUF2058 family)